MIILLRATTVSVPSKDIIARTELEKPLDDAFRRSYCGVESKRHTCCRHSVLGPVREGQLLREPVVVQVALLRRVVNVHEDPAAILDGRRGEDMLLELVHPREARVATWEGDFAKLGHAEVLVVVRRGHGAISAADA